MDMNSWEDVESLQIDSFFRAPAQGDPQNTRRSNLYVLRRDLRDMLCEEGGFTLDPNAPMLAAIGLLSGIDLMAWTTTWPKEPGRMQFVSFLMKYAELSESLAEALYQYRCAQVHAYGLYSFRRTKGKTGEYTFSLNPSQIASEAIVHKPRALYVNNYVISLFPLRDLFLKATRNFESAVRSDAKIRHTFLMSIQKIGFFQIQGWST